LIHNRVERGGFMYSQVSQYFAVNFDACQIQTVDETAVCQSFVIGANARIDALDPQAAEVTLAIMTVASCVLRSASP
jgi:hypothetical protein